MLWALGFILPSILWCYHLLYLFRVLHREGPFTALVAPQTPRPHAESGPLSTTASLH